MAIGLHTAVHLSLELLLAPHAIRRDSISKRKDKIHRHHSHTPLKILPTGTATRKEPHIFSAIVSSRGRARPKTKHQILPIVINGNLAFSWPQGHQLGRSLCPQVALDFFGPLAAWYLSWENGAKAKDCQVMLRTNLRAPPPALHKNACEF